MNGLSREYLFPSGQKIKLLVGDITDQVVDAIVNAANEQLRHGAGVAGAIADRGGCVISEESEHWVIEHGPVQHSHPAVTSAGGLPSRYVIHAVGPVWGEGKEEEKLRDAVLGVFRTAEQLGLNSIALPAISTGIFGFPVALAARIFARESRAYFSQSPDSKLTLVEFVLFDEATFSIFAKEFDSFQGLTS